MLFTFETAINVLKQYLKIHEIRFGHKRNTCKVNFLCWNLNKYSFKVNITSNINN